MTTPTPSTVAGKAWVADWHNHDSMCPFFRMGGERKGITLDDCTCGLAARLVTVEQEAQNYATSTLDHATTVALPALHEAEQQVARMDIGLAILNDEKDKAEAQLAQADATIVALKNALDAVMHAPVFHGTDHDALDNATRVLTDTAQAAHDAELRLVANHHCEGCTHER